MLKTRKNENSIIEGNAEQKRHYEQEEVKNNG